MDKLRSDLKIIRQVQRGEVSYIVKDPVALKYVRFGTLEITLFKYLDGAHDHAQVAQLVTADTGVGLDGSMVAGFVDSLKKIDLIERSVTEKSLLLLERLRKERKLKADTGANGHDVLYMRFPFFDPDEFYNWLIKRIGFIWTREFLILCLILFSLAATIIISNWGAVSTGLAELYNFDDKGLSDILMFIGALFVVIVFHENGHGLTCKRYGGEVHELGFMLIFFLPAFYANVTDAWTFQSKAAKLWVTFAGAFVELIICSLATFVWYFSTPGYFTHDLAFTFMLIAGLSSILINMNPLIKLDGYFALVDYLEVPNLSDDSTKFVTALVRRYIFRMPVEIPRHTPRLRRILFIYGVLAFCYRILILTVTLLFFNRQIGRLFPEMGVFIFPLIAYRLLRKKLKSLWNGVHHVFVDKREVLMKSKSMAVWVVAMAVLLGLFILLPLPYSHRSTFVIEPAERVPVRAATEGFIRAVFVKEGDNVRRGALLAAMRNADLEQNRHSLRSQISVLDRNIRMQSAENATAQSLESQRRRAQLSEQLTETEARLAQLSITAPADGVMVSRRIEDKVGVMLRQGDEFCEIAGTGAPQARVRVDDWDLRNVEVGARASLWLNAAPDQEISGHVKRLAAASELHQRLSPTSEEVSEHEKAGEASGVAMDQTNTGRAAGASRKQSTRDQEGTATDETTSPFEAPLTRFDVLINVDANLADLKPGMSGEAKIYGPKRPLAVTVWRGVRDWFRSKIWW